MGRKASEIDLEVHSIATGLFWRVNPLKDEEAAMKVLKAEIRVAEASGAKVP